MEIIKELTSSFVIGILGAFIYFGVIKILQQIKELKYNKKENKVELELLRKSYESKIYKISKQLASTKKRWKDINHVVLSSQKYNETSDFNEEIMPLPFLNNMGLKKHNLSIDKKSIFILTPFHTHFKEEFNVITDVCREIGLKAYRGDEEFVKTDLLKHIIKQIVSARLIIVNLNGRNPNVFYELGVAHALGKQTILITSNIKEVPFDLKSYKLVVFENISDLKSKIKKAVSQALV